jgi:IgA Peptidase M64
MSTSDGAVIGSAQIFGSAPRNRAFNVVLLAEGFTTAQQNDFNNACTAFVNAFRATPPFDELSPAINIFGSMSAEPIPALTTRSPVAALAPQLAPISTLHLAPTTSADCWSATQPRRCRLQPRRFRSSPLWWLWSIPLFMAVAVAASALTRWQEAPLK